MRRWCELFAELMFVSDLTKIVVLLLPILFIYSFVIDNLYSAIRMTESRSQEHFATDKCFLLKSRRFFQKLLNSLLHTMI